MKRFIVLLTITFTCLALFSSIAEARRFGGGGSFGKQRTIAPQQAPKAPAAAPAPANSSTQKPGNRWLGPLAGLAIGAGIGALFASMGLGQGMGTILMIVLAGLAVFFIVSMFRSRQQHSLQSAGAGNAYGATSEPISFNNSPKEDRAIATTAIPADFPTANFLRSAKTTFIRLQAANDRKDLNDIREYTTPEMFAEISMQLSERDDPVPQKTDVVTINGELLEVANEGEFSVASVRFTGQLRENNGDHESIDEVWHVQKNVTDDKSVWLLAGIQQTSLSS
ncbi:MAG: Tim44-like domain-containing protein [Gallionella sp.]